MTDAAALQTQFERGIRLFNAGHFFHAHEVLEDVWRGADPRDKKFLQGLVQLAVALHHYSTGNVVGSRSVLTRALRNLSTRPEGMYQLRTTEILETFSSCQRALEANELLTHLPKLKMHE